LARREELRNRANNSTDPLLNEVFTAIEKELPGNVQFVNSKFFDSNLNNEREFDIITKKCIIEVKSGKKIKRGLRQFEGQKKYAESKKKKHIVYAPNLRLNAQNEYKKHGIAIVTDIPSLIKIIKEHEE